MHQIFSFVFDMGNVLFTRDVVVDTDGAPKVTFTPLDEGIALLKECHALSEQQGSLLLACTNLKKQELILLKELFPETIALFKGIVAPDVALSKKPDAAIFQYMLATYDLIAHRTLFFDDDIRNIEAARLAGLRGIQVVDFAQVRKEMKRHIPDFALR
ncbi:HAD-IA family hydrolase [Candidatus Dependentiae bacterium]|nr:HAD-IA family hydrolase [Candidatus Dependentiae bacterium]